MPPRTDQRAGLAYGLAAYTMWGLLPLYWHLLGAAAPSEILAHRMLWSLPVALVILAALRRWSWIRPLLRQPKRLGLVLVCAVVISLNWYLYIWAVNAGHVLEASLGYFINPLVSIAFGVLVLRERLRPLQWAAVGVGAVAVVVMTIAYGRMPWIALGLALSFATYGLVKKGIKLDGIEGFSAETALQALPALGFLIYLGVHGESSFVTGGTGQALLLAGCGIATAVPLICFGASAVRLPLTTVGMLQYLAPTFQFLLGLTVFHEEMPPERWAGFALVWAALVVLTWDALRTARRARSELAAAGARAGEAVAAQAAQATQAGPAAADRTAPEPDAPGSVRP
ncbi:MULTISPECIES: EamA family transporter RarD [Streptomyces]|uniref:EamA family transporter RarD n=1 Tax=Streptomyces TaxID=1883 RepID=UPI0019650A19|nr:MULTISPECIES: EamA family transporter RarD [Streptomyces]QRX92930.1 EamA family transporter RarD [Streptomyces noursei]UJB42644.1 EamA family transporter RarD [Streptomyces sp. A1-5]